LAIRTLISGAAEVGQHVVLERADRRVVALDDRVLDRRRARGVGGQLAALGDPLGRPPSSSRTSSWPNSVNTHSAYAAHQLFLSP
jgi:hypothetical protein